MSRNCYRPGRSPRSRPAHLPSPKWCGRAGFTLVELLVCLGIVAVLVAILLPVLSRAREHARSTVCMSRLRQIHGGFQNFAAANKGKILLSTTGTWVDPDSRTVGFGSMYWYGATRFGALTGLTMDGALLQPYMSAERGENVFDCPALADTNLAGEQNTFYRGSGGGLAYGTSSILHYIGAPWSLSRVRNASETVMAADAAELSFFTGAFTRTSTILWPRGRYMALNPEHPVVEADEGAGTPNFPKLHARHGDRANVLWFDGHVSSETLTYVGTTFAPLESYKRLKLGHLAKGDMASLDASYYFYLDKPRRSLF